MILITKQLTRPDGGKVSANSVVECQSTIKPDNTVVYRLTHFISQTAKENKMQSIPAVKDFSYKISKICSTEEWDELLAGDVNANAEKFLAEIIEAKIGKGNVKIEA